MRTPGLNRLRQPEYTGKNRCIPCTTANVVIGAVTSLALGYGGAVTVGSPGWLLGPVVFTLSLVTIWLRGYLVPGTPALTKRYFPDSLLQVFDGGPDLASNPLGLDTTARAETAGTVAGGQIVDETGDPAENEQSGPRSPEETAEEIDPEAFLLSEGVVRPCERGEDLCLTDDFRAGWHDRIQTVREESTERDDLARELDLARDAVEIEEHEGAFVARNEDDDPIGQWASRAALIADLAASRELQGWVDGWNDLDIGPKSQLISGLRIFLDICPECEDTVSVGTETVESCCGSHEVIAANCQGCDARLLEIRSPGTA